MKKGIVIIIIVVFVFIIFCYGIYKFAELMAPGSYPYAERYELNIADSDLIRKIIKFKTSNPQFIPPESIGLKDGKSSDTDLWYHVYFYYPLENEILYTWIRSDGKKSILAFVSICIGTNIYNNSWREINRDFNNSENMAQKKKFEEMILNKLK